MLTRLSEKSYKDLERNMVKSEVQRSRIRLASCELPALRFRPEFMSQRLPFFGSGQLICRKKDRAAPLDEKIQQVVQPDRSILRCAQD